MAKYVTKRPTMALDEWLERVSIQFENFNPKHTKYKMDSKYLLKLLCENTLLSIKMLLKQRNLH